MTDKKKINKNPKTETIQISGFVAELTQKNIKNINLRLDKQGYIHISAPHRCPRSFIAAFLEKKQTWIKAHQERLKQNVVPKTPPLTTAEKLQMQNLLPDLIQKWQSIMGVEVNQWLIRTMKTRWGSCNPRKKRICLNLHLIHQPLICIEYVVVHELVHLLEASHNHRFYALMNQFMPEWKTYRKLLRINGL